MEFYTTVRNATFLNDIQAGVYSVIAFSEDETQFSPSSSAQTIWLRPDEVVVPGGTGDPPGNNESTTIIFYGNNNDRFLVETNCTGDVRNCIANCNYENNVGYITGGFCCRTEHR